MVKTTLTIDEAIRVYDLLAPFWPPEPEANLVLFAGTILKNMRESEQYSNYIEVVALLVGDTPDEVRETYSGDEVLDIFLSGLQRFEILGLKTFLETLGYGR